MSLVSLLINIICPCRIKVLSLKKKKSYRPQLLNGSVYMLFNMNTLCFDHLCDINKNVATKDLICTTVFVDPLENKTKEKIRGIKSEIFEMCECMCISPQCVWLACSLFEEDYCWLADRTEKSTTEPLIKQMYTHTTTTSCWCPHGIKSPLKSYTYWRCFDS